MENSASSREDSALAAGLITTPLELPGLWSEKGTWGARGSLSLTLGATGLLRGTLAPGSGRANLGPGCSDCPCSLDPEVLGITPPTCCCGLVFHL